MLVKVLDITDRDNPKAVVSYSEAISVHGTATTAGMLITAAKGDIIRDNSIKGCQPYEVTGKAYYLSVGGFGEPACIISVKCCTQ